MVGLGGLEPPTSPLSVVIKSPTTDYDGLWSCWFSAPLQAILARHFCYRLWWSLITVGHKMGHNRKALRDARMPPVA